MSRVLWLMFAFLCVFSGFMLGITYPGGKVFEARQLDAYARGYAQGLAEALPAEISIGCEATDPLPAELSALALCRSTFDDYRRTEAANRANARLLGWNDGYGVGRADWRYQPECPR